MQTKTIDNMDPISLKELFEDSSPEVLILNVHGDHGDDISGPGGHQDHDDHTDNPC